MSRFEEEIDRIREALLIGLACYGQCVEIENFHNTMAAAGKSLPKEAVPTHPTGDSTVVSTFADALRMLDGLRRST